MLRYGRKQACCLTMLVSMSELDAPGLRSLLPPVQDGLAETSNACGLITFMASFLVLLRWLRHMSGQMGPSRTTCHATHYRSPQGSLASCFQMHHDCRCLQLSYWTRCTQTGASASCRTPAPDAGGTKQCLAPWPAACTAALHAPPSAPAAVPQTVPQPSAQLLCTSAWPCGPPCRPCPTSAFLNRNQAGSDLIRQAEWQRRVWTRLWHMPVEGARVTRKCSIWKRTGIRSCEKTMLAQPSCILLSLVTASPTPSGVVHLI